jgi:glycerate kinase
LRAVLPALETAIVPMADGGEGTVDAFLETPGWSRVECTVRGPLGEPVTAAFAFDGTRAVVEMSAASGLALLSPDRYDPLRASTFGTGEMIAAALARGARTIVVAIGGSATNDGGAGMLAALGVRFLDERGDPLPLGGGALARLARVDLTGLDPRLAGAAIDVAADVDHPLTGPRGASAVFGPQKGASAADVAALDAALARFADVTAATLGADLRDEAGMGAAGGLGFGLRAYLGATLGPGVARVAALRGLAEALAGADVCFTGEGSIDEQTLGGKTVAGVAEFAARAGARTLAFGGRVTAAAEAALAERGIVTLPLADGPCALEDAVANADALLERAAARVARLLR